MVWMFNLSGRHTILGTDANHLFPFCKICYTDNGKPCDEDLSMGETPSPLAFLVLFIIFENQYFLVTNVFSVSKLILWYLNMSSIDLATRFKIGKYLLKREKRYKAFQRSTYIMQVLNELPTDKRYHKIHISTKRKIQVFLPNFFLEVLHDQTSVESL